MRIRYPFKNEQPTPTTDNLVITVTDEFDEPIENATVELYQTGVVSVTCTDENDDPVENAITFLATSQPFSEQNIVCGAITGADGSCTLKEMDWTQNPPFSDVDEDVPYGTYILGSQEIDRGLEYIGELVVDSATVTETITLTEASGTGTVTITLLDNGGQPVTDAYVDLYDGEEQLGCGFPVDNNNVYVMHETCEIDSAVAEIPYGTYSLIIQVYDVEVYNDDFVVNSAEVTETITLTE